MPGRLRAVQPGEVEKYPKILIFGGAGTRKSFTSCQFPRSYYFDLERGVEEKQYVELLRQSKSVVFPTIDIDEIIDEVTTLHSTAHDFRSVVLDPITQVFNDEADIQEARVGSDYGKNTAEANKKWRRLGKLLKRLNMTVVVTAYEKKEFGSDPVEYVPAGPKDLKHFFDVVLRTEKRGDDVVAHVVKSRSEAFPANAVFPFSFAELAARYGQENLERQAVPVELASADQVTELKRLLATRIDGEELKDKWLKKAEATELSELPAEAAAKCIAYLSGNPKLEQKTEAVA